MPLNRLKTKTTTENLWLYLLALLEKKPLYAYEIRDRVKKRFGFTIGNVTAYMVLYKLERSGYVKPEWRLEENRQRKYYTVTGKGKTRLKEGIKYLRDLAKDLDK